MRPEGTKTLYSKVIALLDFLLPSEAQAIKMAKAVGQPVNIMKNSCKAAIYTSAFVNCVKSLDQTS